MLFFKTYFRETMSWIWLQIEVRSGIEYLDRIISECSLYTGKTSELHRKFFLLTKNYSYSILGEVNSVCFIWENNPNQWSPLYIKRILPIHNISTISHNFDFFPYIKVSYKFFLYQKKTNISKTTNSISKKNSVFQIFRLTDWWNGFFPILIKSKWLFE